MRPGLGVGGYCLTKDPEFINFQSKKYLKIIKLSITNLSTQINKNMIFFN